jgi:hypothetical protein
MASIRVLAESNGEVDPPIIPSLPLKTGGSPFRTPNSGKSKNLFLLRRNAVCSDQHMIHAILEYEYQCLIYFT